MIISRSLLSLVATTAVLLGHLNPVSGYSLTLALDIAHSGPSSCIGGDEGLTNTSVLVEYRPVETPQPEWSFVAEVSTSQHYNQTLQFNLNDSIEAVQFRLLQLEHGGGECNCWSVSRMELMLESCITEKVTLGIYDLCVSTHTDHNFSFCGDSSNSERGAITREISFQDCLANYFYYCPSGSDVLISSVRNATQQNCDTITPRM